MSYETEALKALEKCGVLDAMRWAARSAADRTLADYSEDTGHDGRWLGMTRHILLEDRLNRVFALGKYALPEELDPAAGADIVLAELSKNDRRTIPAIKPHAVKRANVQGSPGWSTGEYHFLIQSFQPGEVDSIRWQALSETKQAIAAQPNPDEPPLFDLKANSEQTPAVEVPSGSPVLVLAHSLDPSTGASGLYLGLPCLDPAKGKSWHWRIPLHKQPPAGGGIKTYPVPRSDNPNDVADVEVRLRPRSAANDSGEAGSA